MASDAQSTMIKATRSADDPEESYIVYRGDWGRLVSPSTGWFSDRTLLVQNIHAMGQISGDRIDVPEAEWPELVRAVAKILDAEPIQPDLIWP